MLQNSSSATKRGLKKEISLLIRRRQREILLEEFESDWAFPELVGGSILHNSQAQRGAPDQVLELVKAITQAISLFKPLQLETRLLRKDLLSLFDIKEFADMAKFTNPSDSLRIEDIICEACTTPRTIDLCRDEDVLPEIEVDENNDKRVIQKAFRCAHEGCTNEYPRVTIEQDLIASVEKMTLKWHCQDLECSKCGMQMGDDMIFAENCTKCGGAWRASVGDDEKRRMRKDLGVMERVAERYEMKMLAGTLRAVRDFKL